jgi:peptidoglycan/LPS O-acetylase OafA/YrhL
MQIYVVYPLLYFVMRRFGLIRVLLGIGLANLLSVVVLSNTQLIIFPSYLFVWMLGATVAEIEVRGLGAALSARTLIIAGLFFIGAGCIVFLVRPDLAFHPWGIGFAVLFINIVKTEHKSVVSRTFAKLGAYSYSIYIVHMPFFLFIGATFGLYKSYSIFPSLLVFIAVLPFSYAVFLISEMPSINVLNRRSANRRLRGSLDVNAAQ